MSIAQFFVLSPRGDTIIAKDCRGDVPRDTAELFFREVKDYQGRGEEAPPIFEKNGINYLFLKPNNLFFLATSKTNISPSLVMELLHRLTKVFKDYCGILTEESIRKNFILIYELLDEIVDNGYPQGTSTELLKAYIFNEPIVPVKSKLLAGLTIAEMNPRTTPSTAVDKPIHSRGNTRGKKQKNEIFVDIFERISVTFNANGYALSSSIDGTIQMKSYLSGNPELKLALNEDLQIGANQGSGGNYGVVTLDDCNFHECVRLDEFESSRTLRFFPPDGEFAVLNYRITGEFRQPFRIFPFFELVSPYKVDLVIKIRADIPEQNYGGNVVVQLPVPKAAQNVATKLGPGAVGQVAEYSAKERRVNWKIKKFTGGTEQALKVQITLSSQHNVAIKKEIGPISMQFEIPMYNVSNLQVRYLRIMENHKAYNPYRWVRYVTKSQSYICRL